MNPISLSVSPEAASNMKLTTHISSITSFEDNNEKPVPPFPPYAFMAWFFTKHTIKFDILLTMHRDNYEIKPTRRTFFMYLLRKCPLNVSNGRAVHPQEAPFTVYADIGMYHVSKVTSCQQVGLIS